MRGKPRPKRPPRLTTSPPFWPKRLNTVAAQKPVPWTVTSLPLTLTEVTEMVSPIGTKLLHILMRESPRVVTRREIEGEIWGTSLPDSDTLRSHLYNLRKVIDKGFDTPLLHTVQSAGYRMADLARPVQKTAAAGLLGELELRALQQLLIRMANVETIVLSRRPGERIRDREVVQTAAAVRMILKAAHDRARGLA